MLYPLSYEGGGSNENGQVDQSKSRSFSVCRLPWTAARGYRSVGGDD
jgi:hypothetical protein